MIFENIFVIPSCISPKFTSITMEDRYIQTLKTIQSIKKYTNNSYILLIDNSYYALTKYHKDLLIKNVNHALFIDNDISKHAAETFNKSIGETNLLELGLLYIKNNVITYANIKRIFKLGGRCYLNNFNISDYDNLYGKYTFLAKKQTWLPEDEKTKYNVTHYYETRLYSFCVSLLDEYLLILKKNMQLLLEGHLDTEHLHYKNIDENKIIEFKYLNCECIVAGMPNFQHAYLIKE